MKELKMENQWICKEGEAEGRGSVTVGILAMVQYKAGVPYAVT